MEEIERRWRGESSLAFEGSGLQLLASFGAGALQGSTHLTATARRSLVFVV